jgi:hypothetical protein
MREGKDRLKAELRTKQLTAESLKVVEELVKQGCKINWTE